MVNFDNSEYPVTRNSTGVAYDSDNKMPDHSAVISVSPAFVFWFPYSRNKNKK